MGANGLTDQKKRGMGDIGGPDLPDAGVNGGMGGLMVEKSLGDVPMSDTEKGYCDYGSITADCGSDPAMQKPGQNNKGSRIPRGSGKGEY